MSESVNAQQSEAPVDVSEVLENSLCVNNFSTNATFMRDLGVKVISGQQLNDSERKALKISINGVKNFLDILSSHLNK